MQTSTGPTFAERHLTPEKRLEIAEAVAIRFQHEGSWQQGEWCSHTMASHAVMNGVPVPVVSRLLGHSSVQMTLRYAHLADRDIEAAAERVGRTMSAILDL